MRSWLSWTWTLAVLALPALAQAGEPGAYPAHHDYAPTYYPAYYYPVYTPTYYPAYYYPTYSRGAVNLVAPPPQAIHDHGPAAACPAGMASGLDLPDNLLAVPFPGVEP